MQSTRHIKQRMSQRGVSQAMVDAVLKFGKVRGDKYFLDVKEADRLIQEHQDALRVLLKIRDKGGVDVVADGETLITTYNHDSRNHWQ